MLFHLAGCLTYGLKLQSFAAKQPQWSYAGLYNRQTRREFTLDKWLINRKNSKPARSLSVRTMLVSILHSWAAMQKKSADRRQVYG